MSRIPLPGIAEAREIAAPVMIEVITGNRWLHSLEAPDDPDKPQIGGWRERSLFTIHEATGLFQAETEYGTYSYTWPPAHRSENLFDFLASLDFGYFMGKAFNGDYREIDIDKTLAHLRSELLRERREGDHEAEQAREIWDALQRLHDDPPMSQDAFFHAWYADNELSNWIGPCDLSVDTRDKFAARHFWDVIWPVLINSEAFTFHRTHTRHKKRAA